MPMVPVFTRRAALAAALSAPLLSCGTAAPALRDRLAALERRGGGRLGVAVLDTGTGRRLAQREHERFAMCSTFKLLAAGCILARVDRGEERLDRRIVYAREDLVTYSPFTERHAGGEGVALGRICEAAITLSDNTAGNLMLATFGGPPGLTAFARALGDPVTRLDRIETALNEATPGDPRDTTSPAAMLENMRRLLVEDVLSPASRAQLLTWLRGNKTGDARLRAGLPQDWIAGDKTGTGDHGAANDIGILWPPGRPPILVAAYFAEADLSPGERNAVLAEVGRIVAAME